MAFLSTLLGGGASSQTPQIDKSAFDLSGAVKKYGTLTDAQIQQAQDRQKFATQANQELIRQLQAQAAGTAPSVAEQQLRSTTNRNLAQTMAMAAAQRGSNPALQQRQLMQQRAAANRDVAEKGAELRLQEAQQNRQLLANQLGQEAALSGSEASGGIGQGFGFNQQAKQLQSQGELAQFNANVEAQKQANENQGKLLGGFLGAAGTLGAGYYLGGAEGAMDILKGGTQKKAYGGFIEGQAEVAGDSVKNDKVPVLASPGEVVLPRSVVQAGPEAAKQFLSALIEHHQMKPKTQYADVLKAKRKA